MSDKSDFHLLISKWTDGVFLPSLFREPIIELSDGSHPDDQGYPCIRMYFDKDIPKNDIQRLNRNSLFLTGIRNNSICFTYGISEENSEEFLHYMKGYKIK